MAEKKKKKLEAMLDDFKKHGGDAESLIKKGRDEKFYSEHILPRAREWTSPHTKGLVTRATGEIKNAFKTHLKGYLEGAYKQTLMDRLGEGNELPEGHEYTFSHLDEEKAVIHAREFLNELIFSGMEYKWGISAKEARKRYYAGDDQIKEQFHHFARLYLEPLRTKEGQKLEGAHLLDHLAEQIAAEEDLLTAVDAPDHVLNKFLTTYAGKLNRFSAVQNAYVGVASVHARTHKKAVRTAASKVAGSYKHRIKDDAEAEEMISMYLDAHGKKFPFGEAYKRYAEPLPKE